MALLAPWVRLVALLPLVGLGLFLRHSVAAAVVMGLSTQAAAAVAAAGLCWWEALELLVFLGMEETRTSREQRKARASEAEVQKAGRVF